MFYVVHLGLVTVSAAAFRCIVRGYVADGPIKILYVTHPAGRVVCAHERAFGRILIGKERILVDAGHRCVEKTFGVASCKAHCHRHDDIYKVSLHFRCGLGCCVIYMDVKGRLNRGLERQFYPNRVKSGCGIITAVHTNIEGIRPASHAYFGVQTRIFGKRI